MKTGRLSLLFPSTQPVRRAVGIVSLGFSIILVAIVSWLVWIALAPLPEVDGSVSVAGVSAPISVIRDHEGVPAIEAATLDDLFFAQGYVTAQDRLFQMDLLRRVAAGELSEIFGEAALRHDRRQRILGLRAQAENAVRLANSTDRQLFTAYARGVNAYIESHRTRLPLEFRILRYAPRLWTMEDSFVVAYQMVQTLSTSPQAALTREKILAKIGPELTSELYVNRSERDHPPGTEAPSSASVPGQDEHPTETPIAYATVTGGAQGWLDPFCGEPEVVLGSNNWVVSGAHSTTGKPLLSNDMHLGHQMPNLWYEAHLRSGGFDVAGVTLPGYPFVIVGHNRRIAWGSTNLGPAVEDAYIETFNGQGQYLTGDGWKPIETRRERIRVRGKADVSVDVQITRHGPIVTELIPGETRKIALRWTLYDGIRNPFFQLDSAENWQEFRRALSLFDAPAQNLVYADVDGNIGYQATGKIPIRARGDGSLPADGSDNSHEWIGYVPFERLPSVLNPASGILATANARITPDAYPYSLSVEWEAPWRTQRIYQVLGSGKKFSAADMLALETDTYSTLDRWMADKIIYAVDHQKSASPDERQAADILRQWNGQMRAESAAPTIVSKARVELKRMLLEPKLGPAPKDASDSVFSWMSYHWMMDTIWLENVLVEQKPAWLPPGYSSYDDLLAAALAQALKEAPRDLGSWAWGQANSLTIQNPVLGRIPFLSRWSGPGEQTQSGSPYTVKAAGRDHGPSERFTADLSNFDLSTLNLVTGNSGNFLSSYYMDQWQAWRTGSTFRLPFSKSAIEEAAAHRLLLEPK